MYNHTHMFQCIGLERKLERKLEQSLIDKSSFEPPNKHEQLETPTEICTYGPSITSMVKEFLHVYKNQHNTDLNPNHIPEFKNVFWNGVYAFDKSKLICQECLSKICFSCLYFSEKITDLSFIARLCEYKACIEDHRNTPMFDDNKCTISKYLLNDIKPSDAILSYKDFDINRLKLGSTVKKDDHVSIPLSYLGKSLVLEGPTFKNPTLKNPTGSNIRCKDFDISHFSYLNIDKKSEGHMYFTYPQYNNQKLVFETDRFLLLKYGIPSLNSSFGFVTEKERSFTQQAKLVGAKALAQRGFATKIFLDPYQPACVDLYAMLNKLDKYNSENIQHLLTVSNFGASIINIKKYKYEPLVKSPYSEYCEMKFATDYHNSKILTKLFVRDTYDSQPVLQKADTLSDLEKYFKIGSEVRLIFDARLWLTKSIIKSIMPSDYSKRFGLSLRILQIEVVPAKSDKLRFTNLLANYLFTNESDDSDDNEDHNEETKLELELDNDQIDDSLQIMYTDCSISSKYIHTIYHNALTFNQIDSTGKYDNNPNNTEVIKINICNKCYDSGKYKDSCDEVIIVDI